MPGKRVPRENRLSLEWDTPPLPNHGDMTETSPPTTASHLPAHPYHGIPTQEDAPRPSSEAPLYLPAEETLFPPSLTLSFHGNHNFPTALWLFYEGYGGNYGNMYYLLRLRQRLSSRQQLNTRHQQVRNAQHHQPLPTLPKYMRIDGLWSYAAGATPADKRRQPP